MSEEPRPDSTLEENQVDAAAAALQRVRAAAEAAGYKPGDQLYQSGKVSAKKRREQAGPKRKKFNPDSTVSLGSVFSRFIAERGWKEPVAVGSVISRWSEIVGPEIAENAQVEKFADAEVVIRCQSAAWATQLRLMSTQLQQRFDTLLGPGIITKIEIKGPEANRFGNRKGWGPARRRR